LLGVFTRPDEAIEADIRDRVIGEVLALGPGHVDITVDQGRVTLEGTVPAKTEARLLEDLVGGVDGVLSVESGLRYLVDDTRRIDEPRPAGVPRPNW